ncbi:DUF927 domain-containing protein [Legionella sp. 31fI33]|uniref:DUF927 domain-containing protein n=1 Tax=Legionella sp. 31fI33 TaxID=2886376 RepID=UPI001E639AEB|nr:DUF927 domain-containing protein [Legionella sp. 31fI33]MCC5016056.1 DUF927 domain-containing protein [Legionella sp. 31fI33]
MIKDKKINWLQGTARTTSNSGAYHGSLQEPVEGTKGTTKKRNTRLELETINPNHTPPIKPVALDIKRPSYVVHSDWFIVNGETKCPGLYWHSISAKGNPEQPFDLWVCSPIHADAITADEHGESFGLLLRFTNPDGKWREWLMPMHLLKGNGDEMRGELLQLGVRMNPEAKKHLIIWLMEQKPCKRILAAMRTGWSTEGDAFVLPNKTLGNTCVRFQSESTKQLDFLQKGTISDWRESIALKCKGNPILLLAISAAFTAPILLKAKQQTMGGCIIHLVGKSSSGKTTALQVAASVWGNHDYVRSWRATTNGLEAIAAALNDSLLILDEISECDPREIGTVVYALANGQGKQRARRTGCARECSKWRIIALSSGERTLTAHMQESGMRTKAGQEARLLSIPATDRSYGAFDELHGLPDGRAFADYMKQSTSQNYGVAGHEFIKNLLHDKENLPELYARVCELPEFITSDGIESRAAGMFALIAMAGEKATEYGLTGWEEGTALKAAIDLFNLWRDFRGRGQTESRQILQAIREFIDRHGDSRFSELRPDSPTSPQNSTNQHIVRDRAGYWKNTDKGRIFMFNSGALQEAAKGYDLSSILKVLRDSGWIAEQDKDRNSKKIKIERRAVSLYCIRPTEEEL